MMDFKMTSPASPMLFSTDGYRLVVMPMVTEKAREYEKANQAEAETTEPVEPEAAETAASEVVEAVAEAEAITKAETRGEPVESKPKRKRKVKEPVAV